MYGWMWQRLPGPVPVKAVFALALFLAVVAVLFRYVFPWLAPRLPFNEVTVESAPVSATVGIGT